MTLRPALHSTNDPPIEITNPHLKEYVQELRRRIEVQNDLMTSLSHDIQELKSASEKLEDQIEQLTIDLSILRR